MSPSRTITLRARAPRAGVLMAAPRLRWPNAQPDDDLDYSIDATEPMADAGDVIVSATAAIRPWGAGELAAAALSITGPVITVWLSGGLAGRDYELQVEAQTAGGRRFEWLAKLLVGAELARGWLPPPANCGFGAPIAAGAALPLALSLDAPLSFALAATLF